MTSIAELGIRVDSTDAAQAGADLDKLTAAGGRAEKAAEGVSRGADKAAASIKKQKDELSDLLGEIDPTVKALGRLDELETKLAKQKKLGALDSSTFSEYQGKIDQSRANLGRFDDSLTRPVSQSQHRLAADRAYGRTATSSRIGESRDGHLRDQWPRIAPGKRLQNP